jgi:hypothetical protein
MTVLETGYLGSDDITGDPTTLLLEIVFVSGEENEDVLFVVVIEAEGCALRIDDEGGDIELVFEREDSNEVSTN